MSVLGRFLELSVPAPEIRVSRDFYLALGFTELPVNDIRPWPYAALTDGRLVLGLHGGGPLEQPALAFVQPDLARHTRTLEAAGLEFLFQRLGADEFNEAALLAPDRHLLLLLEARTYSPGGLADAPPPLAGTIAALGLRSGAGAGVLAFWQDRGFALAGEEPLRVAAGPLVLDLDPDLPWAGPVLRLAGPVDPAALERAGIRISRQAGRRVLVAPEGTRLLLPD